MNTKRINLTEDGRVYMDAYILNKSPEMYMTWKRPAVVVFPGGGYQFCSEREGEPIAMAFAAQGFQTFVVYYSVGKYASWPNSLMDVMKAMKVVRENSEEWCIDKDSIAVCGFSAGGHLTASLGTYWNDENILKMAGIKAEEAKPNALILCYPVILGHAPTHSGTIDTLAQGHEEEEEEESIVALRQGHDNVQSFNDIVSLEKHVGKHTPPTFICATYFDQAVPIENSLEFANALARANVPFELHISQDGVHGLALGTHLTGMPDGYVNSEFAGWPEKSGAWLRRLFNWNGTAADNYPSALGRER